MFYSRLSLKNKLEQLMVRPFRMQISYDVNELFLFIWSLKMQTQTHVS